MNTKLDRLVRAWARETYGVFRRDMAVKAGANENIIRNRVTSGDWVPVGAAAFLVGGAPLTWRGRLQAAVWDGGERALVSHGAAAQLHRFPGFRSRGAEILVPKSLDHVCTIATVHESRRFDVVRTAMVDRLPVTAPEDTLVHVAPRLRLARLDWLLDELVLGRRVDLTRLHATFADLSPGCRGMRMLRSTLQDRIPGRGIPESKLERLFLAVATAHGLPSFALQVKLPGRDQRPFRVTSCGRTRSSLSKSTAAGGTRGGPTSNGTTSECWRCSRWDTEPLG